MPQRNLHGREPQKSPDGLVKHLFSEDREFDLIYPDWVSKLSDNYWTPLKVAQEAARFLVTKPGTRVLDIGCGPGKFCAVGAATTDGHFTGIEQRDGLVSIARQAMQEIGLSASVKIIHANVVEVDFCHYDAFYCFNPFYEHVVPYWKIDSTIKLDRVLYTLYCRYVRDQLTQAPLGTRVATYHGDADELPGSYRCEHQSFGGSLKLWVQSKDNGKALTAP